MIVTLTGRSGAGKGRIAKRLMELCPDISLVVSLTTRGPKPSDLPGEYRHNVPLEEFELRRNEFLWVTEVVHGNRYGTLRRSVDEALESRDFRLMTLVPSATETLWSYAVAQRHIRIPPIFAYYVLGPSENEIRRRLVDRGDNTSSIEKRIVECRGWDQEARKSLQPRYRFVENRKEEIGVEHAAQTILKDFSI